ncbi:cofactor assembly of complex C subunit B [Microcoleus sp. EPA2]|uniref:cofactor assembly of complex C subunit B n=1 Tax=Microcoleus sp. EPA2 TaxID=2841654 RepID=UPI00312BAF46
MNNPVLPSTFVLTLVLAVGLFFFIKASVKDRTEQVKLASESNQESLLTQLQEYFAQRAYRVAAVDAPNYQVTFEGFVRPSWFLAIFLTLLSAGGALCLGLVLAMLVPQQGQIFLALVLLSPLAGIFYWKKAGRPEQVSLKLESVAESGSQTKSLITVRGHRDELAVMQKALALTPID